jgi:hypothetical protein
VQRKFEVKDIWLPKRDSRFSLLVYDDPQLAEG